MQGKKPHILYLVPVGNVSRSTRTMHMNTVDCRIRRASYCLQIDTTPYTPCANSTIYSCGWALPLGLRLYWWSSFEDDPYYRQTSDRRSRSADGQIFSIGNTTLIWLGERLSSPGSAAIFLLHPRLPPKMTRRRCYEPSTRQTLQQAFSPETLTVGCSAWTRCQSVSAPVSDWWVDQALQSWLRARAGSPVTSYSSPSSYRSRVCHVSPLHRSGSLSEISTQVTNNWSQAILASYLSDKHWGTTGFIRWLFGEPDHSSTFDLGGGQPVVKDCCTAGPGSASGDQVPCLISICPSASYIWLTCSNKSRRSCRPSPPRRIGSRVQRSRAGAARKRPSRPEPTRLQRQPYLEPGIHLHTSYRSTGNQRRGKLAEVQRDQLEPGRHQKSG